MSLVSFIGPRPNVLDLKGAGNAQAPRSAPADPHQRGSGEDPRHRRHGGQPVPLEDARHHLSGVAKAPTGMEAALDQLFSDAELAVQSGDNIIILSDRAIGPRPDRDPVAAGDRRRPPSPDPQGPPHLGRPRGRDRRRARDPPFLRARRLWRRGDQPLSRLRDAARHEAGPARRGRRARDHPPLHQGDRQGHPEGHRQDGHLDLPVLLRRADLRRRRPRPRTSSTPTSPAPPPPSRAPASPRSPRRRCSATAMPSATRRCSRTRSMSAATTPSACAARRMSGAPKPSRTCSTPSAAMPATSIASSAKLVNEVEDQLRHHPLAVPPQERRGGRPHARAARGGRARRRDRQALLDRRHVLRLDLAARRTPRSPSP